MGDYRKSAITEQCKRGGMHCSTDESKIAREPHRTARRNIRKDTYPPNGDWLPRAERLLCAATNGRTACL
jgi:hypothetical protein